MAYATDETILVPRSVGDSHDVSVGDGQTAAFTHLRSQKLSGRLKDGAVGCVQTSMRPNSNLTADGAELATAPPVDDDPAEVGPSEAFESP